MLGERALAADMEHRTFRAESGCNAGDRVGASGSRRGDDAAQLAGLARIPIRGMRRDLLMAHIDDADTLIDAAVVDVDDVAAAQREDGINAFILERFRDQSFASMCLPPSSSPAFARFWWLCPAWLAPLSRFE